MNEAELGLSRDRPHLDWFLSLVLASGYGAPVLAGAGFVGAFAGAMLPAGGMLVFMVGAWGLLVWSFRRWIRLNGRARIVPAFEVLVLGVLPAWGLAYNHLLSGTCITNQCSSTPFDFRPFAEPEVYGLASGHALVVLAYAISRRRRAALPGLGEMIVGGALLAGVALQAMVALQLGAWLLLGLVAPPVFLPTLGPLLAAGLFLTELRTRLKARGLEALEVKLRAAEERNEASLAYRAPAPEPLLPGVERVDAPSLVRAIAASPILVGLYAVAHAAWLHAPAGALQVFTRTCDHTLSHVPIVVLPADCHYLCTVAARGHAGLVKPLRIGRRGGIDIVVNRQLALANAFEDLLHERWPRFGKWARRVYDRVGWPLSRSIQSRWASDLVYLAMKPAEWIFYVALLLLDRASPERRIERMYR